MAKTLVSLVLAMLLAGCGDDTTPSADAVHTSFSETTGLTVVDGAGNSQQLIPDSLAVRAVVSPSGQWIVVEDMQLSNLVVIRAFRRMDGRYHEVALPGIRRNWEELARDAGVAFEDLVNPSVGFEGFDASERTILLLFRAETPQGNRPDLAATVELPP